MGLGQCERVEAQNFRCDDRTFVILELESILILLLGYSFPLTVDPLMVHW